jgi:hypothetical protein
MRNNNQNNTTWIFDNETGLRFVFVSSLDETPVSRSNGCYLHDCPGCFNIWALSPYRRISDVVSRSIPLREGGVVVDYIIAASRLTDACWCGVPFPLEGPQQVTEIQARANVKKALHTALSREGEEPSVLEEIQTLRSKITPSLLRLLRGENSTKAQGVA